MLLPRSWLADFVPPVVEVPVDDVVSALNQLGLEVDGVDHPGREVLGVRAARIVDVVAHPDADRLRLADVDSGDRRARVVCGAPDIRPGMLVPYAPPGATLPGGVTLERRRIRGVESEGMLLSASELGLGHDHSGIVELDAGVEPGTDVREALGLDDVVLELAITPNRPDAMCVVGVARELAAHFGWPFAVPEPKVPTDGAAEAVATVTIEDPQRCPRYLARVARVALGPSPAWLARRLVKAGMRPINNVVDVTNYVMLERNQPLHAFDRGRLAGGGIVVRLADTGERITTLDGVDRDLAPDDLLICDGGRAPRAVAGIMGGADSEVVDATTEILLEAAYFEPMGIARSARRMRLRSEASARFERGIDPEAVDRHADRAMELLVQVAGASVAPTTTDEHPRPVRPARIRLRTSRVNALLGTDCRDVDVRAALEPLEIAVEGTGDDLVATAPTFRPDLEREIDLVEEVARRIGFDAIGRTVPKPEHQVGGLDTTQRERRRVTDALVGAGLSEAITLSLVAPGDLERVGAPTDRLVEATNPLRAEESVLRTRLLPGLLRAVAANAAHGLGDAAVFETGRVFLADAASLLPSEPNHVAAVLAGRVRRRPVEDDRPVDGFDARDALGHVLAALEVVDARVVPRDRPGFAPGRSAVLEVGGREVGVLGEVHDDVRGALGIESPAAAFEADLDALLVAPRADRVFRAPSPFPPAAIDLAFVVAERVPAGAIVETLRNAGGPMLEDVSLFDEFRSETLGAGRRSLAFTLRFRAPDRTLTDAEVGRLRAACIDAVSRTHAAELRA